MTGQLTTSAPATNTGRVRYEMFAVMWALANIIHLANQSFGRLDNPAGWANLVAATWVLLGPRSRNRLALLAALQVTEVIWVAPLAPDHAILVAAVNLAILIAYFSTLTHRGERPADLSLMRAFVGPARIILLTGYTAAALAKYNSNFFDPIRSCATFIADKASLGATGDGSVLGPLHIALSAGTETLIPVLLIVPASRRWGARLGVVFHFLVSLSPAIQVGDFTTALWPLFLLFLCDDDLAAIQTAIGRTIARSPIATRARSLNPVVAGTFIVLFAGAGGRLPNFGTDGARLTIWAVVTLYGLVLVGAVVASALDATTAATIRYRPNLGNALLVLVFFLWVLNPYLGFRTMGAFTMFSGLVTEGPGTNHFFMPSVHLVDEQNDLVVLETSNNRALQDLADDGQAVPYFEIRRVAASSSIELTGTRNGEPFVVDDSSRHLLEPLGPVWAKLWIFRAVPAAGEPLCIN